MKEKYLSKEYTNCLRGIFALLVVVHHLYQYSGLLHGTYIGMVFQLVGSLSVAMFFFFSGYGLMFSSKKENYIAQFFHERFLPLYCFYVFLIIIYSLWTLLLEGSLSPVLFIRSFFFGGTVVTNGWYLQATFVVYLLYMLIFKRCKAYKMQILLFSGCIFVYCAICHFFDMSMIWYQNVPCLVFGMIYYAGKEYIDRQLETRAWGILAICGILFAGCTALAYIGEIPVIFDVLYFVFFVCCIISLSYILANTRLIQNSFFALCGAYSLEIYVTHGLFLRLIKIKYIEQLPVYVYVLLVIVGTILMSVLMKKVYRAIVLILKKKYRKTYQ